jgi:3',5'-cyclic AMP phosphodiesterase CpdA
VFRPSAAVDAAHASAAAIAAATPTAAVGVPSASASSPPSSVKFVAIADMGHNGNDNGGLVSRILEAEVGHQQHANSKSNTAAGAASAAAAPSPPDVLLHAGDLAYDFHTNEGSVGDQFMVDIEAIAATVPYMVAPGNHEAEYNFSHIKNRFSMPQQESSENLYYSFDLGPVHFISYNTEAYFAYGPGYSMNRTMKRQYEWLENDLKSANEASRRNSANGTTPWIVVMGHRPFYCNVGAKQADGSYKCDGEQEQSRTGPAVNTTSADGVTTTRYPYSVEDLFYKYGVDLALFGHVHDYSRFLPGTVLTHCTHTLYSYTVLTCTTTLASCQVLCSHTALIHCTHTLYSYTILTCTTTLASCRVLCSHTALTHCTHTLYSYTALIHCTHTLHSYTALLHCTPTLYSHARLLSLLASIQPHCAQRQHPWQALHQSACHCALYDRRCWQP